jgi:hypothetical protein
VTLVNEEAISRGRDVWFKHICSKTDTRVIRGALGSREGSESDDRDSAEVIMLILQVGLGHLLGYRSGDIAIDQWLAPEQVDAVIARVWRTGQIDADLSRFLAPAWQSVFQVGSDSGALASDLVELLRTSTVGRWVASQTTADLRRDAVNVDLVAAISDSKISSAAIDAAADYPTSEHLDVAQSHIPALRLWALKFGGHRASAKTATPLELLACYQESSQELRDREWLEEARAVQHVYMSMPGSWPGLEDTDVPPWVRENVLGRGGRMATTTSGHVPGLFFVAESDEEVEAFRTWTFNPSLALDQIDGSTVSIGLSLPFRDPEERRNAWYYYRCDDVSDLNRLRTTLAMGVVRVDLYRISSEAELLYIDSIGVHLPPQFVEIARTQLDDATPIDVSFLNLDDYTTGEWLQMMASLDRSAFERLQLCRSALISSPTSPLAVRYAQHLAVAHSCGAAVARGAIPDGDLLAETYQAVRAEIGRSSRGPLAELDLGILGPGRGYLQLRVTQEEQYIHGFIAYVDSAGSPQVERVDFSSSLDLHELPDDIVGLVAALADGMSALADLLANGVTSLVINMAPGIYNLPVHEAMLSLGFNEASYSHRLSSLAVRNPLADLALQIVGWAGEGRSYLHSVDLEMAAVTSLYQDVAASGTLPPRLPGVVHLAGHATTGDMPYDVALHFAPGEVLTPARVLLEVDAGACDVVVLSACSTGAAQFRPRQITDSAPLDVAMIEAGARCVLATAAPVNDTIAAVFSCAFHFAYKRLGYDVWNSYAFARSRLNQTSTHVEFDAWLSQHWVDWGSALAISRVAAPNDWMLFRLSGRHW